MAERGIEVSYETIRRWVEKFGPSIARRLGRGRPRAHPQWHLDEMYLLIGGRWHYLWRAIDQYGEVLDILVQAKREKREKWAARKLMRKLLKKHGFAPRTIVSDKWLVYGAALRDLGLRVRHHQAKWKNNRIEGSHVRVRRRERARQGYRSPGSAQRFLAIHAAVYDHFPTRRHLISAAEHRSHRDQAFMAWRIAVRTTA